MLPYGKNLPGNLPHPPLEEAPHYRHIYLNYLCLWLVKYIETQWRARGYTGEVVPTLRRWDQALRYTELLDKDQQATVGHEWTRGEQARQAIQEIRELEEQDKIQPSL